MRFANPCAGWSFGATWLRDLWQSRSVVFVKKPILYNADGFAGAARYALTKLGVVWEPTYSEKADNEGHSTPTPINHVVRVKGRFSRRLRYGDTELVLER